MKRHKCNHCAHNEYLHNDRIHPTGECQVEGCTDHIFRWVDAPVEVEPDTWQLDLFEVAS